MIGEETCQWDGDPLLAQLRSKGIPCGRVNSVAQALADPHALERNMVLRVDHAEIGEFATLGTPLRLSDTPTSVRLPPPRLGEHTEQVLREDLGLSPAQISSLMAQGVIGCYLDPASQPKESLC